MKTLHSGSAAEMALTYSRYLLAATWVFFVFVMLSYPMPPSDEYVFTWRDKLVHFFLFGILAVILIHIFWNERKMTSNKAILTAFLISASYIIILELLQNYFPGRTPDIRDSLAGLAGVAVVLGAARYSLQGKKQKLLLHTCCIVCGIGLLEDLKKSYEVALYFYNPNIFPKSEYNKRLKEAKRISKEEELEIIVGDYDHKKWLSLAKGHEREKEGGERCRLCIRERLFDAARQAKVLDFGLFTTTLTASQHKDSKNIIKQGKMAGWAHWMNFLPIDFKLGNANEKSREKCRNKSIYRQSYCGCEFSETYGKAKKQPAKKKSKKPAGL